MRTALLLTAGLLIGAPAFAQQSLGEKSGVNSLAGIAPTTQDFVQEAAIGGLFEVQSSQLAEQRAQDPSVKAFAERMVADHTKANDQLKQVVSAGNMNVQIPATLDSTHQTKLDKLQSLNGNGFTQRYDNDQVTAHEETVSLFQRYAKGGDNPALKQFAQQTLPTLQDHLAMAKKLPE